MKPLTKPQERVYEYLLDHGGALLEEVADALYDGRLPLANRVLSNLVHVGVVEHDEAGTDLYSLLSERVPVSGPIAYVDIETVDGRVLTYIEAVEPIPVFDALFNGVPIGTITRLESIGTHTVMAYGEIDPAFIPKRVVSVAVGGIPLDDSGLRLRYVALTRDPAWPTTHLRTEDVFR